MRRKHNQGPRTPGPQRHLQRAHARRGANPRAHRMERRWSADGSFDRKRKCPRVSQQATLTR